MTGEFCRKQVCFGSERVGTLPIAAVDRSSSLLHITFNLFDRLLLAAVELAVREFLQIGVSSREQLIGRLEFARSLLLVHTLGNLHG